MAFIVGQTYSRQEISNALGGSVQSYLPMAAGHVVCGCFQLEPRYNPGAPEEVTHGEGPIVEESAEVVSRQREPIPIFLFRSGGAWEYVGLYRCSGYSTDPDLLQQKMRENPARGVIKGVLYFQPVQGGESAGSIPARCSMMTQKDLFAMLGAPLVNTRWSWGSVRQDGVVFLRVWQDEIREQESARRVRVLSFKTPEDHRVSLGYEERIKHVQLVKEGAPCYLILCESVDVDAVPRTVQSFNKDEVFPGRNIVEESSGWWIELGPAVPVRLVAPLSKGDRAEGGGLLPKNWSRWYESPRAPEGVKGDSR